MHTEDSIVLDLKSPKGITTGVELLCMPQWDHLSSASATVVCPQTKQEKINIVLSAAADPLFEVSETVRRDRAYLPLHVQKDQRAVRVGRDESVRKRIFAGESSRHPRQEDEEDVKLVRTNGFALEIEEGQESRR